MKQIKLFYNTQHGPYEPTQEDRVNEFIAKMDGSVLDIKIACSESRDDNTVVIMVIYEGEE